MELSFTKQVIKKEENMWLWYL